MVFERPINCKTDVISWRSKTFFNGSCGRADRICIFFLNKNPQTYTKAKWSNADALLWVVGCRHDSNLMQWRTTVALNARYMLREPPRVYLKDYCSPPFQFSVRKVLTIIKLGGGKNPKTSFTLLPWRYNVARTLKTLKHGIRMPCYINYSPNLV